MVRGWFRVAIGGVLIAFGLGALLFVYLLGGSRRLAAGALAVPAGIVMVLWGLIEVAFKLGKGLFGETPEQAHPLGSMVDAMIFVATAAGKASETEVATILRVLNQEHGANISEKALQKRIKLFAKPDTRSWFNFHLGTVKALDDAALNDIAKALIAVYRADRARDPRKRATALMIIAAVEPDAATKTMFVQEMTGN